MRAELRFLFVCLPLISAAAVDAVSYTVSRSDLLPALQHPSVTHKAPTYYLPSGEDWRPSGTPQVSVLMAGQPLNFRTDPRGANASLQSVRLLFKCSSTDSKFNEALLDAGVPSSTHCRPLRPFTLERVSHAMYRLTLSQENQVPFKQALRHTLEFRLRLSFHQGELESASLFVFNFDALSKLPNRIVEGYWGPRKIEIHAFTTYNGRKYLRHQNVEVVSSVNIEWRISNSSLQILSSELVSVLKQAEPMVRNLLSLSFYYSRNCSVPSEPRIVVATAGVGKTVSSSSTKAFRNYLLNPDNGMLHFTYTFEARNVILDQLRKREGIFESCLSISVKGGIWPYFSTFVLVKTVDFTPSKYKSRGRRVALPPGSAFEERDAEMLSGIYGATSPLVESTEREARPAPYVHATTTTATTTTTPEPKTVEPIQTTPSSKSRFTYTCFLPTDETSSRILLPAHLRGISLSCPVFCNDDLRFKVGFEGSHCSNEGSFSEHAGRAGRPPCSRFFSVSPNSCDIDLVGLTSEMHAGKYTIIAGVIKYTYHVSVVSLPLFTAESVSTETLHFDPKSEPASLSCAVTYSGIEPVELVPRFRLLERFKPGQHWVSVSPLNFGISVLDGDPRGIALSSNRTDSSSALTVRATSKKEEAWWVSWKASFECSASVTKSEARLFGLPEYRVQETWSLAFIKDLRQTERAATSGPPSTLRLCAVLVLLSVSCTVLSDCFAC
ncbi:hypothetical protein BOX15_Mlig012689g1 [Macrostomum lignano]|uniref:Uncharacterized protein n=2 Tax=Macrostomum lignano TaxID=282301 RepID=A0A267G7F2_9PLAT|nr:hypothetical protein BOX15_Mlig012689g1 [Macrostomum lignano]